MAITQRTTPLEPEEIEPRSCTVARQREILALVPFFIGLSPDDIAQIYQSFHASGYLADQVIYAAGDPATLLYVIAAGKVKVLRHTLEGQDVLLDILAPGEFFGSLSSLGDTVYQDSALAHTDVCTLAIDAAAFEQVLLRYPAVAVRVLSLVAQRLQSAQETIRDLSVHSVEMRIAGTLLYLAGKMGRERNGEILITTPLSREDLAQMSGTTPESASRVMSQFRKAGLIRSGRRWVAVVDREALARLAPTPS